MSAHADWRVPSRVAAYQRLGGGTLPELAAARPSDQALGSHLLTGRSAPAPAAEACEP